MHLDSTYLLSTTMMFDVHWLSGSDDRDYDICVLTISILGTKGVARHTDVV
jgi:hypothetical protein